MIDAIVTGASGFIGRALYAKLCAKGWDVLPLTSENGDVAAYDTWVRLPAARVLFHLAGRSFVPESWAREPDFMKTNVMGTENALAYCRQNGARLVFASGYVYGIPKRLPIRETHPALPNNPYALSKRLAEQLCEFAARYHGVVATALRLFNVFGPGQRSEFLIPKVLEQIRVGREIRLQNLSPKRDYVYLDDVVDAFIKASEINKGFHVINVGSGQSLSVAQIVDKIQSLAGTRLPVNSDSVDRRQEIADVIADISLAQKLIGWRPQTSFDSGIEQMLRRI